MPLGVCKGGWSKKWGKIFVVDFAMNDVQRNMSCFVMGTMWFDQSSNQWNASKKKDAQTQKSVNKVRAVRKLPLLTNSFGV